MSELNYNDELKLLMKERDGLSLELQALVSLDDKLDRENSLDCVNTLYLIELKDRIIKIQKRIDNMMKTAFPAIFKEER